MYLISSFIDTLIRTNTLTCTAATQLFTTWQSAVATMDQLTLTWETEGIVIPYSYHLTIECKYEWESEMCLVFSVELNSTSTSFTISNVNPGVTCNFVLLSVYNPASFDEGISLSTVIIYERKRLKTIPCVQPFILSFSYLYVEPTVVEYALNAIEIEVLKMR